VPIYHYLNIFTFEFDRTIDFTISLLQLTCLLSSKATDKSNFIIREIFLIWFKLSQSLLQTSHVVYTRETFLSN